MRLLLTFLTFCLLTSCSDLSLDSFEDLEGNPLEEGGGDLFTLVSVNFIPAGTLNRNVEVNYEHVYESLPLTLQNNITDVVVSTPRGGVRIRLDRTRVVELNYAVGEELCYSFAFLGSMASGSMSRETEFCFTVE